MALGEFFFLVLLFLVVAGVAKSRSMESVVRSASAVERYRQ
jgi:hypothetical protein